MRLVSYNVLAAAYVKPEYYVHCQPEHLDPLWRRRALVERLLSMAEAPAILCLQEIEPDLVRQLEAALTPRGYQGHFLRKGRNKPDGCAIFVHHPQRVRWSEHHYRDESGHCVLLAHLPEFSVATTHLKWDPPERRPGYGMGQITELLARLQGPSIVCGDFNCTSQDPIVEACRQAGLIDAFEGVLPNHTFVNQGPPQRIDFLLHSPELSVLGAPSPVHVPGAEIPDAREPSDHLPLLAQLSSGGLSD